MIKNALVVGGANGIGLSIALSLAEKQSCEKIYVVDKVQVDDKNRHKKIKSLVFDLTETNYDFFDQFNDINALFITAGFGKLALFKDIDENYIINSFNVNTVAALRIIHRFYERIHANEDFYACVMVSIAGFISSPFFSVYGASKAALKIFIESVNVELLKSGTTNRILNVSPGSIKGTSFYNKETQLATLKQLTGEIIHHTESKHDLFIPQYDSIFKNVLERYNLDFRAEGIHSYEYKQKLLNQR